MDSEFPVCLIENLVAIDKIQQTRSMVVIRNNNNLLYILFHFNYMFKSK